MEKFCPSNRNTIINTMIIKKDKKADPKANATELAPPIKDLICDKMEAQISEKAASSWPITSLNKLNKNVGRILSRTTVNFIRNLVRVPMDRLD